MTHYYVYDDEGRILRTGSCPESMLNIQPGDGEFVMEGCADDSSQYILNGKITDMPRMPISVVGTVIKGIPFGAVLRINDESYVIEDGVADLLFDFQGPHIVHIDLFPYTPETIEVES